MTTPAHASEIGSDSHKAAMRQALQGIIDAVKAGGSIGAPGGVLYAALIGKCTLGQFETVMSTLVKVGCLRKEGQLYFFEKDI